MTTPGPAAQAVGAILRDARDRRMMLPEQPAELLGITPHTVHTMEDGHHSISTAQLEALTGLYRCGPDQWPLWRLLALNEEQKKTVRDDRPGHARRLAACIRQAHGVRWLSTALLPAPLQIPDYARAVAEHPTALSGAPVTPKARPLYVLDVRTVRHGSGTPRLMAEQVEHLLGLADAGTVIRVLGEDHPLPQQAGHLVELDLPAGRLLAQPGESGVDYHCDKSLSAPIADALALTDCLSSRKALERAAAFHRALATTSQLPGPAAEEPLPVSAGPPRHLPNPPSAALPLRR
ncbi:Scr1 family TA system antitoxin-like transcriptional regulator [Streptomyces sp. NPDC015350]|uniref:Scr1 family TA system antitoxin-like transcriptional regulator n=1 Tax=Streptomyces sp. NPDC015350 TaxID=3364955 RepID=UPI0036FD61C2